LIRGNKWFDKQVLQWTGHLTDKEENLEKSAKKRRQQASSIAYSSIEIADQKA